MTTTVTVARTAHSIPDAELVASARRRIYGLAARYGWDSPQVRSAIARWGHVLDRRTAVDDLTAVVDALTGGAR